MYYVYTVENFSDKIALYLNVRVGTGTYKKTDQQLSKFPTE